MGRFQDQIQIILNDYPLVIKYAANKVILNYV